MILSCMNIICLCSGVVTGVLGTLIAMLVRKKIKAGLKGLQPDDMLTMEKVTARAATYLREHSEVDSIAVVTYQRDNIPQEITECIKVKLPENVRHVVVLFSVQDDEPRKAISIFFAQSLEIALEKALESGILKIER